MQFKFFTDFINFFSEIQSKYYYPQFTERKTEHEEGFNIYNYWM